MTDALPDSTSSDLAREARPRGLRTWFFAGFLFAFVGLLLFTNHYFYTGEALVRCKLWQYYLLSIQRASTSSGVLGPTSGTGTQAFMTFLTHLAISSLGGLVLLAIGAVARRFGR